MSNPDQVATIVEHAAASEVVAGSNQLKIHRHSLSSLIRRLKKPKSHSGLQPVKARPEDAQGIVELLAGAAPDCLPIGLAEVHEQLNTFRIFRDALGKVIATCSARHIRDNLYEIRSVFVHKEHRGLGLGRILIESFVRTARRKGWRLACVTRSPGFFASIGFQKADHCLLPEKKYRPGNLQDSRRVTMLLPSIDYQTSLPQERMRA